MTLKTLSLTNFRNYSSANFAFGPTTTLVVGPNTAGKTNLLEAIYFLATGRSFRATHDREAIAQGKPFANVKCQMSNVKYDDGKDLELQILANENGENTSSKRFKVNGVKKRLSDFAGNLRAVYFGPEEILLVTGSPSRRRKYLDSVLVQVDREYARALLEYEKVLRQRNRLLVLIREGEGKRNQLDFWDEKLWNLSEIISGKRALLVDSLNIGLGGKLKLIVYQSKRSPVGIYDLREREIAAGMTLYGPHRDDFRFVVAELALPRKEGNVNIATTRDLAIFGSRGEQRLAVLHLKLAELEFISERVGERPVLLLDDIFSELDENNRERVLELLGKQQTIVTTTDLEQIDGGKLGPHEVIHLSF